MAPSACIGLSLSHVPQLFTLPGLFGSSQTGVRRGRPNGGEACALIGNDFLTVFFKQVLVYESPLLFACLLVWGQHLAVLRVIPDSLHSRSTPRVLGDAGR